MNLFFEASPCAYCWVGLGSFGRSEILPYSDIEYLWLFDCEDLSVRWYFWALDKFIQAQIYCLNEPKGLLPDQYTEVSQAEGTTELLPHSMKSIQKSFSTACQSPEGVYTQIISNLQGKIIHGDVSLWQTHRMALLKNNLTDLFQKILFVSVEEYQKVWEKETNKSSRLNVKSGYGYFIIYLAVMLKFYHQIEGTTTSDIYEHLIKSGNLNKDLGEQLIRSVLEIQTLRYRTHHYYKAGHHNFSLPETEKTEKTEKFYKLNI